MATTLDEVARIAEGLPEVTVGERHGNRTPPAGPILAVRVADLHEKEAVLAANPTAFFTIPHFDGYAAVLIELRRVTKRALSEAIHEAWRVSSPLAPRPTRAARGSRGSPS